MTIIKWTGLEVAALRTALRDTQVQFADRIGCSIESVGKWERRGADITLGAKYSECMDTARRRLDDEQQARFEAARQDPDARIRPDGGVQPDPGSSTVVHDEQEAEFDELNRRQFGTAFLGLTALAAKPSDATPPVAPELVDYFRSQLAGHYTADRFLGSLQLIPTAIPQYELLCRLAGAATGRLRGDFWSVGTGYAAFIGWLYQDAGDLRRSAYWLDQMLERAHRSQDVQLVGFALHNKAMLEADKRDGHGVLDLTGAALQQRTRLCPKVEILLLQQAAHGTSLIASDDAADECGRLLDQAADLLDAIDDEYPWGACRSRRYIDVQRATVWTRLGRTNDAMKLWEEIIPDIPASESRDRGVFSARYAQALAAAGEPEQAVATVSAIPPLVVKTSSARMRAELFTLRKRMEPWSHELAGRELEGLLSNFAEN
ncbi:helix-turn-helix domain-containing protein [Nocardia sp. NPDC058499]|uniref:helix-turn-helix domain-containing protein n=1 Tax=Nocardia sp. NPDC058499 TaxID=3346530 RepID=UPI003661FEA7